MNFRDSQSVIESQISPTKAGQRTIVVFGLIGTPGQVMGPMGLTYSSPVADHYEFQYRTNEGTLTKAVLTNV